MKLSDLQFHLNYRNSLGLNDSCFFSCKIHLMLEVCGHMTMSPYREGIQHLQLSKALQHAVHVLGALSSQWLLMGHGFQLKKDLI